ncbi:MAG: permease-like cell division protein FtsX [bacterium]
MIQSILFLFLFFLLLCLFNISPFISFLYHKIEITAYLKEGIPFSSLEALMKRINQERKGIEIRYQSKEDALKGLVPAEVVNILDKNPLCSSFKIRLFGKIEENDFDKFISFLSSMKDIEKISYSKEALKFLSKIKHGFLKAFLWICGICSSFIIIILILLSLMDAKLYKEEREILYLSGRTKWSLVLSSLISSMIDGLFSSLIAFVFLFIGWTLFVHKGISPSFEISFFSFDIILSLAGIGILLGFITKIPTLFFL